MQTNNNLITQADTAELKSAEELISANLSAHVNASLSKAHGFEFVYAPTPTYDAHGNDISTYQNSNGDIVGHHQMRLNDPVSFVSYYVPLESTTLAGQPALTGVPSVIPEDAGQVGGSAWVTEQSTNLSSTLPTANSAMLLPHTQLAHWEAHAQNGVYAILPQLTYDAAGYLVGDHVARIAYNGVELLLPCSSRRGGPSQPPVLLSLSAYALNMHTSGSSGNPDLPVYVSSRGQKPITFAWYYASGINGDGSYIWTLIAPDAAPYTVVNAYDGGTANGAYFQVLYSSTTGTFQFVGGGGQNGGESGTMYIMCTATGPGGTTNTLVASGQMCTCTLNYSHDSSSWFCTEADRIRPLSKPEWRTLRRIGSRAKIKSPECSDAYYAHGNMLVKRMLAAGYPADDYAAYVREALEIATAKGLDAAADSQIKYVKAATLRYWPDCPHISPEALA